MRGIFHFTQLKEKYKREKRENREKKREKEENSKEKTHKRPATYFTFNLGIFQILSNGFNP